MNKKYLFLDRDGTLIVEPNDQQVDSVEKLDFLPGVIPALLSLQNAGYTLVMVSNQDGLGCFSFPIEKFEVPHRMMLTIFSSQGIVFERVCICPHTVLDHCTCRKPAVGLVLDYLKDPMWSRDLSYVIGDRDSDLCLAENMGISGIKMGTDDNKTWDAIARKLLCQNRSAVITRNTTETNITVSVNLDQPNDINIKTGIGFFDHMLEQLVKHGGFSARIETNGDLQIDEHHTVEDTAIALGEALRFALGNKFSIARYGFVLPMDEALTQVALDLSGRSYFVWNGTFTRECVGELPTELVPHFFHSLANSLKATLHIRVEGENAHHMIESVFKATGRALRDAIRKTGEGLPSTKGIL